MKRKTTVSYDFTDTPNLTVSQWFELLADFDDLDEPAVVSVTPIMGGDERDPHPTGLRVRITTEKET